jgi:hypothetical protein
LDPDDLVSNYPTLFHMAEGGSWPSVKENGLLSTRALLDLFDVSDPRRSQILRTRRQELEPLRHPDHGTAVIRDQLPLREGPLEGCLTDMTLEEWFEALNSRVFFWLDEPHLETLLGARAYRDRPHDVIHVDTTKLIQACGSQITLSPINSGNTMYNPRPRGSDTFKRIADYPFEERRKARGLADAVIELAVGDGVRDIAAVTTLVESRQADGVVRSEIWRP